MKSIFIILEVLLILQSSHSQEDCNPSTKCAAHSPGYKVVDPKDCHNYYICIEDANGDVIPSDSYYECSSGYYFYENNQQCQSGTCSSTCLNLCPVECTLYEYERIADQNDCSAFYTCRPGNLEVKSVCPSEAPYFDGDVCTTSSFSCCDTCVPYCEKQYTEIADPFNCRNYYMCTTTGRASEDNKSSCPETEVFDPTLGKCIPEDPRNPCVPVCSSTTTTTTTIW
ncbi:UNVERIFIED_CONTAM: hypothetical protein RMT77_010389 [Armadillidium vulgare]